MEGRGGDLCAQVPDEREMITGQMAELMALRYE